MFRVQKGFRKTTPDKACLSECEIWSARRGEALLLKQLVSLRGVQQGSFQVEFWRRPHLSTPEPL